MTQLISPGIGQTTLPVIDIAPLRGGDPEGSRMVAHQLREACMETGFFYAADHGVDPAFCAGIFAEARRFFDLPLAMKERVGIVKGASQNGYSGIGGQQFDAATGPDNKESMYLGVDRAPDDPLVLARTPLHDPNPWPDFLPGWRQAVLAYFATMEEVARLLLSGLALSLDLASHHFDPCMINHMSALRLLHYPPHPTADPTREVGCGTHTDWGALTVLSQDMTGGLEICLPSGRWIAAPPVPGTFIVNIGDMMARWTNDLYASTPHRVLNRSSLDRYSVAFFFDPYYHTRIDCLATCCSNDRPARYPPITAGEHILEMKRRTYGY